MRKTIVFVEYKVLSSTRQGTQRPGESKDMFLPSNYHLIWAIKYHNISKTRHRKKQHSYPNSNRANG